MNIGMGFIKKSDHPAWKSWMDSGGHWKDKPFGLHGYRADHFMKEIPVANRAKYRSRLVYCVPDEASWVSGGGISGILLPLEQIVVTEELLALSESHMKNLLESAVGMIERNDNFGPKVGHDGEVYG
jgi:hypothetical protein